MTKTRRNLYEELRKNGFVTSAMFSSNLDEIMTDEEYERTLKIHLTSFEDDEYDEDDDL